MESREGTFVGTVVGFGIVDWMPVGFGTVVWTVVGSGFGTAVGVGVSFCYLTTKYLH